MDSNLAKLATKVDMDEGIGYSRMNQLLQGGGAGNYAPIESGKHAGNSIYVDPNTGEAFLANPAGIGAEDFAQSGRMASSVLGGILGGAVTAPGILTTAAGAAAGSQLGSEAHDAVTSAILGESVDDHSLPEALHQVLGDGTLEMGLGLGIPAAGKFVAGGAKKAGSKLLNKSPKADEAVEQMKRHGIKPTTVGAATNSPLFTFMEQRLGQFPTGLPTIEKAVNAMRDSSEAAFEKIVKGVPGTAYRSGEDIGTITKDAMTKRKDKQLGAIEKKYNDAFNLVDQDLPAAKVLPALRELRKSINAQLDSTPASMKDSLGGVAKVLDNLFSDAAGKGGLSIADLRAVRTALREKIGNMKSGAVPKTGEKALLDAYTALNTDLSNTVRRVGGFKGKRAIAEADAAYADWMTEKQDIIDPVINASSQKAYNWLMSGAAESGERLASVIPKMDTANREIFESSVINRLGYKGAGNDEFSIGTFVGNYNKLSPAARKQMFGDRVGGLDELNSAFNFLLAGNKYLNASRTGDTIALAATYGPLFPAAGLASTGQPVAAAAMASSGFVAPWAMSKLITSKPIMKQLTMMKKGLAKNPNSMGLHLSRLMAIGASSNDPELAKAVGEYVTSIPALLGDVVQATPAAAATAADYAAALAQIQGDAPAAVQHPNAGIPQTP